MDEDNRCGCGAALEEGQEFCASCQAQIDWFLWYERCYLPARQEFFV